jgi:putative hemolysin
VLSGTLSRGDSRLNQLMAQKSALRETAQARYPARFRARLASCAGDIEAAQALRARVFRADRGDAPDADRFDDLCRHMLIERASDGALAATFRLFSLASGTEIGRSYSAQYYALEALEDYAAPMVELGRFCVVPELSDPDVLRVAWGALARVVDEESVEMLFGCSSFQGTEACNYSDAFAMLRDRHLAPRRWRPRVKAPDVFRFARALRSVPDRAKALKTMPPLLRSYLTMGGWVSDHAVVDRDLNTLHVFTGLEISAIPPARARAIRAAAG